jgi:hypothetical protein
VIGGWRLARLDMEPEEFEESYRASMISAWIESHWPKDSDPYTCRHCRARHKSGEKKDGLIPVGTRNHIWMHYECYDAYWAGIRLKALRATGFE